MSTPPLPAYVPATISEAGFERLSPEEKRRVGTAMQLLVDLNKLHLEGLAVAGDLLEGKTPSAEVGMKLIDFERTLRIAADAMLKRPLQVAHAEAVLRKETKLDDSAWLKRMRIGASEAREVQEETARQERFRAMTAPSAPEPDEEEPEPESGMRP